MKRTTPMQMAAAKSSKSAGAGQSRAMTAYANKRSASKSAPAKKAAVSAASIAPSAIASSTNYDAQYDLDTLTRAAAIKADGKRHAAAMNEAKKKQAALKHVMGSKG